MATKEEQARQLAQMHYNMDSGLKHVFKITGSTDVELKPDEPIKLLEVNQDSFPSGILPLHNSARHPPRGCIFLTSSSRSLQKDLRRSSKILSSFPTDGKSGRKSLDPSGKAIDDRPRRLDKGIRSTGRRGSQGVGAV